MSKIFGAFRRFSSLAMRESNIYTENVIVYNKQQKYFQEHTKTCVVNNKYQHICVGFTGNICTICKGHGIIFNPKSVTDFNYYKLCENCNGKGYL